MTRQIPQRRARTATDLLEPVGRRTAPGITTEHSLLTGAWMADVETMEAAIGLFTTNRPLGNHCSVMLFEIAGDARLHVNVIHQGPRRTVRGWAGPGRMPTGCVYNRRFDDGPPETIIEHIRNMVFA